MSVPLWNDNFETWDFQTALNWIQNPAFIIKFCKAINERVIAYSQTPWLHQTGSRDGDGFVVPYVPDPLSSLVDIDFPYPEDVTVMAPPIPTVSEEGRWRWITHTPLESEFGSTFVDIFGYAPDDLIFYFCQITYGTLAFYYSDEDNPTTLTARDRPNYLNSDDYAYTTSVTTANVPSVDAKYTTTVGGVKTYNYPRAGGPIAKYPREINTLTAPGTNGWIARIVAANLFNGSIYVTWDASAVPISGSIVKRIAGVWVVQDDLTLQPDIITERRPPRYGDYVGPWVLQDLRDALNMMRRLAYAETGGGNVTRPTGLTVASYLAEGTSSFVNGSDQTPSILMDEEFPDPLDQHTFKASDVIMQLMQDALPDDIPIDNDTLTDMALAAWSTDPDGDPSWGGGQYSESYHFLFSSLFFLANNAGPSAGGAVFHAKPVISTPTMLQEMGIKKRVKFWIKNNKRTSETATYIYRNGMELFDPTPPPVYYGKYQFDFDDQGSGLPYWDGNLQPNLYLAQTIETTDALVVGDYVGSLTAPSHVPEWWEVVGNDADRGGVAPAKGIVSELAVVTVDFAIEGGFRYSHLTTT